MAHIHHGLAIKRLREIRGLKQEALALEMGEHWSQRRISLLEGKEEIDEKILGEVATALAITVDQIENFCENSLLEMLTRKSAGAEKETEVLLSPTAALLLDKLMQQTQENKALYERLLQSEKEKTELLRQYFIPTTHGNNNGHPKNS